MQFEYLRLDPSAFASAVDVDRVELRKRWQRENPGAADADFIAARPELERQLRVERADEIMAEADQIVRGELLRLTRPLDDDGPYKVVPSDWPAAGPDYERIAQLVVRQVQERLGVTVPAPVVVRRTDRWLTARDVFQMPGFGRGFFRIGAQQVPVAALASFVREVTESDVLRAQIGVPILDPYAVDAEGRHYYITVLGARAASAPESLDEVRTQVLTSMRTLRAFERLDELATQARLVVAESGLSAGVSFIAAEAGLSTEVDVPTPTRDLIVFDGGANATLPGGTVPEGLRNAEFTDAVLAVAQGLDPLAQPDTGDPEANSLSVSIPRVPAVALTRVRALRPLTAEAYRASGERLAAQLTAEAAAEVLTDPDRSPFTLDGMAEKLGYTYDYRATDDFSDG